MLRGEGRMWAVCSSAAGTVLIAAGAFWLSFVALADLAHRSGIAREQAWIWPLLVDGLIVVATVAVVALDGHGAAWYPWTLLIAGALVSVTANAIHALVTADTGMPPLLAAAVASVPPLVLLASTHLTVVLIRSTRRHPAGEPATAHESTIAESTEPLKAAESRALPQTELVEQMDAAPSAPAARESAPAGVPVVDQRAEAARMRAECGWSNKRIARELGVHASTVGRWFRHAHPTDSPGPEAGTVPDTPDPDSVEPVAGGAHSTMKEATP